MLLPILLFALLDISPSPAPKDGVTENFITTKPLDDVGTGCVDSPNGLLQIDPKIFRHEPFTPEKLDAPTDFKVEPLANLDSAYPNVSAQVFQSNSKEPIRPRPLPPEDGYFLTPEPIALITLTGAALLALLFGPLRRRHRNRNNY